VSSSSSTGSSVFWIAAARDTPPVSARMWCNAPSGDAQPSAPSRMVAASAERPASDTRDTASSSGR
jgi:hypothetical protein